MLSRGLAFGLCGFAYLLCTRTANPQETQRPKLRVQTTLVVVPVSVTDHLNRFVVGLEKQNFSIYEDGIQQQIAQFSGEDVPLSVGILVDTSASMGSKLSTSRQAAAEFLKTMNPQDEAFLVEFNTHASLTVPFTKSPEEIKNSLASTVPDGTTALLDAVNLGVESMKSAHNARKALLIISDGGENSSKYTSAEVKETIRKADVQVYGMGVFDPLESIGLGMGPVSGPLFLATLCQQTGGRVFPASSYAVLPNIARRIGIELRNQYVLAYSPINHNHNGEYRKLEVKIDPPPGLPAVKARWRLGYYAPID
ncbi:MAG TPA: VWA domain-containing protein [Bryobacteraceae bacterium]|nr:VWA domain-containing protein [Bryobacteraceae bacterium]